MTSRAYTVADICALLQISRAAFYQFKASGQLPFVEELRPRIGRCVRFRADLIDRYLANEWRPSLNVVGRKRSA